jgi:histidine triad (HIT) family protein
MRYLILFVTLGLAAMAAETAPCVFCEIVAGKRQQESVVWRGEKCTAFLSIGPANPGHLLIVPNEHAENFLEVPAETMHAMTDAAKHLAEVLRRTDIKMEGFHLMMNTGKTAGQSVFHAHLHLIPRYAGDGKRLTFIPANAEVPERRTASPEELAVVAEKIRAAGIGKR